MDKGIGNYIRMEAIKKSPHYKSKYVYRIDRSTETVLPELSCVIQKTLDEKETAIYAFLEISVTFDNTSHDAIRRALEARGVGNAEISTRTIYLYKL